MSNLPQNLAERVPAATRNAASSVRRHRDEMLILAATLAFVVIVALVSLPAVF